MIVIADTSVLLNLCQIGEEDLLWQLYGKILVPRTVADEFARAVKVYPGFEQLAFPGFIQIREPGTSLNDWLDGAKLDAGESNAIALAMEIKADLLLMDERKGRAAAKQLNLSCFGILGVLLQARQKGLIQTLRPLLSRLKEKAGFYLSERQIAEVLAMAGEG